MFRTPALAVDRSVHAQQSQAALPLAIRSTVSPGSAVLIDLLAWIGVGTLDILHDEAVDYAKRLAAADVPCDIEVVTRRISWIRRGGAENCTRAVVHR